MAQAPRTQDTDRDTDAVVDVAAALRLSVTRLARQLRQQSDAGLTPTQLSALAAIERHGPLSPGALAEHERVAAPTVTRVTTYLAEQGLVDRMDDPDDRRAALLVVTRAGRDVLRRARTRKDAWLSARVARLDAEQVATLAAALDALEALTELDDEPPEAARR
ncbi:MAG: MarR family transcriptional regulator [Acidimicrobiales bacterium]|nr:MarR family transcriptional regulator [Acidimicrobiales bacterium]